MRIEFEPSFLGYHLSKAINAMSEEQLDELIFRIMVIKRKKQIKE